MEMGNFGEPFLRKTPLKPQLADCCTQRATRIGISHKCISKPMTKMSLHTIGVIVPASGIDNLDSILQPPGSCREFVKIE